MSVLFVSGLILEFPIAEKLGEKNLPHMPFKNCYEQLHFENMLFENMLKLLKALLCGMKYGINAS